MAPGAGRDGRLAAGERQMGTKTGERSSEARYSPGIEHNIECGKSRRVHAGGWNHDFAWNRIAADDVESISCDFDAAREANSQLKLSAEVGDRVAHAVPFAEPPVCHHDHKARKHAPKRAVRDIGRS